MQEDWRETQRCRTAHGQFGDVQSVIDFDHVQPISPLFQMFATYRLGKDIFGRRTKVADDVINEVRSLIKDQSMSLTADTVLIGDGRVLDSMALVELCLRLEDRAGSMGFEFDWTSESAMSRSRSMFRTVGALQEEFSRQYAEQQA